MKSQIQLIEFQADTLGHQMSYVVFFDISICSLVTRFQISKWPKNDKFDLFFDPTATPN